MESMEFWKKHEAVGSIMGMMDTLDSLNRYGVFGVLKKAGWSLEKITIEIEGEYNDEGANPLTVQDYTMHVKNLEDGREVSIEYYNRGFSDDMPLLTSLVCNVLYGFMDEVQKVSLMDAIWMSVSENYVPTSSYHETIRFSGENIVVNLTLLSYNH